MEITRRSVLRGGVAALVASTVPLRWVNPLAAVPAGGAPSASPWLTRLTYLPLVDSQFSVRTPDGATSQLKLLAVRDLPGPTAAVASTGCFSLLFDGGAARFGQGAFPISHHVLGSSQLFFVPVGPPAAGRQAYEVVVNRP